MSITQELTISSVPWWLRPQLYSLNPATSASLGKQLGAALSDPQNAVLKAALLAFDNPARGGNGNGSPVDELVQLLSVVGTVTPEQATDPNAIMLTLSQLR